MAVRDCYSRIVIFTLMSVAFLLASVEIAASASHPPRLLFLGAQLQNDNAALEPTTDAERNRLAALEEQFLSKVSKSGSYSVVPITADLRKQVQAGQQLGQCSGCEAAYGKTLHADRVAWITVQKVSNLILNLNLYVVDVASGKTDYVKSVDIRGNTDESWSRSLKYLLNNYFLAGKA